MVEIKDYDADSYELEFEENTSEEERKFYVKTYPNVNMVADKRLHCTTCNTHIGCAVANELTIRMHPVLRVTHCKKCHTFYNSGEFSKGEDGSELYCRWCGQGGEVYCCSKCAYVFCKKCIVQNLSKSVITEIENNDNWQCFSCSPNVMWPLRAQHWALVNYIEKTKKRILAEEKDDEKIYELMNKDPTLCCRDKKSQKSRKQKRKKRRYSSTSDSDCSLPEPKRIADHSAVLPKMVTQPANDKSSKLDELVCTPDILSMFNDAADEIPAARPSKTSTTSTVPASQKTPTSQPPPLVIRQLPTTSQVQTVRFPNRQFSAVPRVSTPPAYYTVNGFRVDLNAAAQQETYRLPNGKLIQVKKQTASTPMAGGTNNPTNRNSTHLQPRSNSANPNPYSIRFNIQSAIPQPNIPPSIQQAIQPPQVQIQHQVAPPIVHQTPAQALHQQHLQQQQQILNGMTPVPITATLPTATVVNRYPNTPLGQAQTALEKEIHGAQDICQQIIAKCNTLMKSNAYKSVRSFNDVKDLQLHLSYLFTYTIDKFTTLQAKCTDTMKSLSNAHEAANKLADKKNKYTNVDDDLEVVEPTTVCIEIDSDDDIEPKRKAESTPTAVGPRSKQPRKTTHQPKTNETVVTEISRIESGRIEIGRVESVRIESVRIESGRIEIPDDADELELPLPPALEPDEEPTYDRENDEKLKSLPQVVLEKNEEIERKLQEILENEKADHEKADHEKAVNEKSDHEKADHQKADHEKADHEKADHEKADHEKAGNENADNEIADHEKADNEKSDNSDGDVVLVNDEAAIEINDSGDCLIVETDEPIVEENISKISSTPEDNGSKEIHEEIKILSVDENVKIDENLEVNEIMDKIENDKEIANVETDENDKQNEDKRESENAKDDKVIENEAQSETDDKADKLQNGKSDDDTTIESSANANNVDFSCPQSPALTDNLENELLDETDNSFENISSPDMFDDMSKNGFDKATENIVTLSTENADPDLV